MRALFYNHTGRSSGAEKVLLLALKHLDRAVISPRVVCPPGDFAREVEELDIPVNHISEFNARITLLPHKLILYTLSLIQTVWALRSEIRLNKTDLVHANSPRGGIVATFATVGMSVPVIWHLHDEFRPHPITTAIRLLIRMCRRCTVIAVSEATAESFVGDTGKLSGRVLVIHNSVDIAAIDQGTDSLSIRNELRLSDNDFLFGIVGQITPRKGQLELIEAFARLAADRPSVKLLVIGSPIFDHDTSYQTSVRQTTGALGLTDRVLFLGHRTDAIDIIKQLDTLVINSKSEAFVLVGLEAMACKTPIIATNVGGTREMIEDCYSGLLIPHGDSGALLSALATMFENKELRNLCVARAREKVEKEFNLDRFISDLHSALITTASNGAISDAPFERPLNAFKIP
jgi:glycosyltransferase involved in cell wall biosynthesis